MNEKTGPVNYKIALEILDEFSNDIAADQQDTLFDFRLWCEKKYEARK